MVMKKYTFEEVLDMNGDFIAFFRRKVPADKSERNAYLLKIEEMIAEKVKRRQFKKDQADKVFKLISCNAEYLLYYFLNSARSGETLDDYFDDKE